MRGENAFKNTYWRVAIKNHLNDAKIAAARQLVRVIFGMLKSGEAWDPSRFSANSPGAQVRV